MARDPVRGWLAGLGAVLVGTTLYVLWQQGESWIDWNSSQGIFGICRTAVSIAGGILGVLLFSLAAVNKRTLFRAKAILATAGTVFFADGLILHVWSRSLTSSADATDRFTGFAWSIAWAALYLLFPIVWGCALARWSHPADHRSARLGGIAGAVLALVTLARMGVFLALHEKFETDVFTMIGFIPAVFWVALGLESARNTASNEHAFRRARRSFAWGAIFLIASFIRTSVVLFRIREDSAGLRYDLLQAAHEDALTIAAMLGVAEYFRIKYEQSQPRSPILEA